VFLCLWDVVGYTMDTMYFSWLPEAVEVADDLEMPQFTLQKHELNDCSQSYTAGTLRPGAFCVAQ